MSGEGLFPADIRELGLGSLRGAVPADIENFTAKVQRTPREDGKRERGAGSRKQKAEKIPFLLFRKGPKKQKKLHHFVDC
jgi:hypothetical protein